MRISPASSSATSSELVYNDYFAASISALHSELEDGIFSKINHIPLLRDDPGVQLYMAHIVQDLRLIYQIDCDVRRKGEPETQCRHSSHCDPRPLTEAHESDIRIYELDRKASINETFWRGVASQLSQRGKEYRKKYT